jgi:outer membrane protein assembly factor BamE (lipoprotein component of BamABCDE complex)
MKKIMMIASFLLIASLAVSSCTSVSGGSYKAASGSQDRDLTVGTVQKEIRKGMSGAQVAEILGSPNIVTKDEDGLETWVYDRIATEATYSEASNVMFLVLYAQSSTSSRATVSQKTLTVVIKMNDNGIVESFSYHASKF